MSKKFNIQIVWSNDYTVRVFHKLWENRKMVFYSKHYMDRVINRKCTVPTIYELQRGRVVQVEIENGDVTKATIRTNSGKDDICTTVLFLNDMIVYMTAYKNCKNDNHKNLNINEYCQELETLVMI